MDQTLLADTIAEEMRNYYENHRETWWDRYKYPPNCGVADNLMLGLLGVVKSQLKKWEDYEATS